MLNESNDMVISLHSFKSQLLSWSYGRGIYAEKCVANKPQLQTPFDKVLRYNGQDTIAKQFVHAMLRIRHQI